MRTMDAADWDKPWQREGDWFRQRGGGFALYSVTPANGTLEFTVRARDTRNPFANPKVRWVADYTDPKTYALFEIDRNTYTCTDYRDGKPAVRVSKKRHGVKSEAYAVRLYVEPGRLVVMLMGDDQKYNVLDDWLQAGRDFGAGRFGFYTPGSDEAWLTHFAFFARPAAADSKRR